MVYYYKSHRRDDTLLTMRMKEIANTRLRYGFRRIFVLLRREGFSDNHKRVYSVYKACGLNLRAKKTRRSRSAEHRLERLDTQGINKVWSMDFVQDALFNSERFRVLTVVDDRSKICHGLLVGKSLKGIDFVAELSRICLVDGCFPERIHAIMGANLSAAAAPRKWICAGRPVPTYSNRVSLDLSRPGKPTDNPYVDRGALLTESSEMNVHPLPGSYLLTMPEKN